MRSKAFRVFVVLMLVIGSYIIVKNLLGENGPVEDNAVQPDEKLARKSIPGRSRDENLPMNRATSPDKIALTKQQKNFLRLTRFEYEKMFDTPVEFFGQVLDQFDNPVVGVKIKCSTPPIGSLDTPLERFTSAPEGRFEIKEINAFSISVTLEPPEGYGKDTNTNRQFVVAKAPTRILEDEKFKEFTPEQKRFLEPMIGAIDAYKPDKDRPMIFRLIKR